MRRTHLQSHVGSPDLGLLHCTVVLHQVAGQCMHSPWCASHAGKLEEGHQSTAAAQTKIPDTEAVQAEAVAAAALAINQVELWK